MCRPYKGLCLDWMLYPALTRWARTNVAASRLALPLPGAKSIVPRRTLDRMGCKGMLWILRSRSG